MTQDYGQSLQWHSGWSSMHSLKPVLILSEFKGQSSRFTMPRVLSAPAQIPYPRVYQGILSMAPVSTACQHIHHQTAHTIHMQLHLYGIHHNFDTHVHNIVHTQIDCISYLRHDPITRMTAMESLSPIYTQKRERIDSLRIAFLQVHFQRRKDCMDACIMHKACRKPSLRMSHSYVQ